MGTRAVRVRLVDRQAVPPPFQESRDADPRPDGSVLARGDKPNNDVYEVDLHGATQGGDGAPAGGPSRPVPARRRPRPRPAVLGRRLRPDRDQRRDRRAARRRSRSCIARATEDYAEAGHPARLAIDGMPDTGWTIKGGVGKPHAAVFELREPVAKGTKLRVTLHQFGIHQTTIGRFRLATTSAKAPVSASGVPAEVEAALVVPAASRTIGAGRHRPEPLPRRSRPSWPRTTADRRPPASRCPDRRRRW